MVSKSHVTKLFSVNCMWLLAWVPEVIFFSYHTVSTVLLHLKHFENGPLEPGGVLPYMGYIGMCCCEGYGFQAVYSRIGYINQSVWV